MTPGVTPTAQTAQQVRSPSLSDFSPRFQKLTSRSGSGPPKTAPESVVASAPETVAMAAAIASYGSG